MRQHGPSHLILLYRTLLVRLHKNDLDGLVDVDIEDLGPRVSAVSDACKQQSLSSKLALLLIDEVRKQIILGNLEVIVYLRTYRDPRCQETQLLRPQRTLLFRQLPV